MAGSGVLESASVGLSAAGDLKIDSVRVIHKVLPRVDPNWRTSTYARGSVDGFYLEIKAGDLTGVAASAAHPSRISPEQMGAELRGPVHDALLGASLADANRIRQALRGKVEERVSLVADLALWDLTGKLAGLPCYELWGGAIRESLAVIRMVGVKTPDALVENVQGLVDQGYTHFKVKIGTGIEEDLERVRALRSTFGDRIWIGVDGNGAYSSDDAIALSRALEPYDIRLIEQPVADGDIEALAHVTAASPIPIMADQVVENVADALAVCQRRAAHVVSIKATKMGTLDECRRVVEVCQAFGVHVHVGGSAGPSGPDAGQLQLAATLPWIDEEAELGESLAVAEDLTSGLIIREGRAYLNTAPGLGITLAAEDASAAA